MILAAGLTPAFQQILVFDTLRIGQVNRAREAHLCASGKALNVALAVHHLGGSCRALSLLGGVTGKIIDRELISLGVAHDWIWTREPTRMCTTLLDRSDGTTTELVENARPVTAAELDEFIRVYRAIVPEAGMVVLSGSLPTGTPKSFYRDLIAQAKAPVVLDASGPELLEALPLKPLCVKPNREELARTLERELDSDDDMRVAMREVCRLGAQWVLVSHGSAALWAHADGHDYTFHTARVTAVNPIGSGDCLAAGIAWGLTNGMDMPEAIRIGIAAAADNASALLPARLDPARVLRLKEAVGFEEVE